MTASNRWVWPWALVAMVLLAAPAFGADAKVKASRSGKAKAAAAADEPVDEPLLVIPKNAPPVRTKPPAAKPVDAAPTATKIEATLPKEIGRVGLEDAATKVSHEAEAPMSPAMARWTAQAAAAKKAESGESSAASAPSSAATSSRRGAESAKRPTVTSASRSSSASPAPREFVAEPRSLFDDPKSQRPTVARHEGSFRTVGAEPDNHAQHNHGQHDELVPTPEDENITFEEGDPFMPYGGDNEFVVDESGGFIVPQRRWSFVGGGEWLMLRPHFSQATAITETTAVQSGATTVINENLMNFNPGYQGAFRTYIGMRNNACGDEFRFSFLNYNGSDNMQATATANTSLCDFICNTTPNPGDSLSTRFGMGASLWDIDCIRPFFCTPQSCDPCGPQCRPWDLRWFGGLRIAYINHNVSSLVTDATNPTGIFSQASASNKFTGVGPRIGLQGRKFFGPNNRLSFYARGSGSLLVGNVYQDVLNSASVDTLPTATRVVSRNSRIIPAAEVELGATYFVLPRLAVSGGWMMMSFWDLGLQEFGNVGATPNLDDSNILGFDGIFLRGEFVF